MDVNFKAFSFQRKKSLRYWKIRKFHIRSRSADNAIVDVLKTTREPKTSFK